MPVELRPYQTAALNAFFAAVREGHKRVMLCSPTGSGKTEIAMGLIEHLRRHDKRISFVVDRTVLVEQTSDRFASAGILHGVQAGANTFGTLEPVMIRSAQTVRSRGLDLAIADLNIVDEAHIRAKAVTEQMDNGKVWLGLSASPFAKGLGDLWDTVINVTSTDALVESGHLAPLRIYCGVPMEVSKRSSSGEYDLSASADEAMRIVGGMLEEWETRCDVAFGGPEKTIVFSNTVEDGRKIAETFRAAGYEFHSVSYLDDDETKANLIAALRRGDIMGLVSCEMLCLSDDTEILTDRGWVGIDEMTMEHAVAQAHVTPKQTRIAVTWTTPEAIARPPTPPTMIKSFDGRFRVTPNHRMLSKPQGSAGWREDIAGNLVGKHRLFPISGYADPLPPLRRDVRGRSETKPRSHRKAANAYALRKTQGMGRDESLAEAEARLSRWEQRTAPKATDELTLDECLFIGFWVGDGHRSTGGNGGHGYSFAQSTRYLEIVEWFDSLARRTGYVFSRYESPPKGNQTAPVVTWAFPRGTGFGDQERRGVAPIEAFLSKDDFGYLFEMTGEQFAAWWFGLCQADGDHGPRELAGNVRRINTTRKPLADTIQAVAALRGYYTNMREVPQPNPRHNLQYSVSLIPGRDGISQAASPPKEVPSRPGERVWCVTVPSGWIVTRRAGKVTITGNSRGFDVPDIMVGIDAHPWRKSLSQVVQQAGRAMRTSPGKDFAIWIDSARNALRHRDRLFDFWARGIDELIPMDNKVGDDDPDAKDAYCPECKAMLTGPTCKVCGWTRPRPVSGGKALNGAEYVDGEYVALDGQRNEAIKVRVGKREYSLPRPSAGWEGLCWMARQRGKDADLGHRWCHAQYHNLYGEFRKARYHPEKDYPVADTELIAAVDHSTRLYIEKQKRKRA